MAESCKIPQTIYDEYLEVLFSIDGMKSAYSSKKRYIKYDSISTEDIEILMNAANELINKLISDK